MECDGTPRTALSPAAAALVPSAAGNTAQGVSSTAAAPADAVPPTGAGTAAATPSGAAATGGTGAPVVPVGDPKAAALIRTAGAAGVTVPYATSPASAPAAADAATARTVGAAGGTATYASSPAAGGLASAPVAADAATAYGAGLTATMLMEGPGQGLFPTPGSTVSAGATPGTAVSAPAPAAASAPAAAPPTPTPNAAPASHAHAHCGDLVGPLIRVCHALEQKWPDISTDYSNTFRPKLAKFLGLYPTTAVAVFLQEIAEEVHQKGQREGFLRLCLRVLGLEGSASLRDAMCQPQPMAELARMLLSGSQGAVVLCVAGPCS